MSGAQLLSGVRVVEIAGERGAAAGAWLASLGASVAKAGEARDAAYDAGKTFVSGLDLAGADIVIGSSAADFMPGAMLDPARLAADQPGLIVVSLTPFGMVGERALWQGPEIVVSALGGCLGVTGYEDRAPVKEALDACGFHAEMMAAAGAMAALFERETSGLGQHVDISVAEVAASRMTNGILSWQFDQRLLERTGVALSYGKARVRCVWDLADGHVFHSLMTGRFGAPANAALSAWMDETGFANPMQDVDWLKYDRSALDAETRAIWEAAIDAFFRSRTKAEMREEGRRRGINACVVNTPGDVLDDGHLEARGFWESDAGVKRPARFVRVAGGSTDGARGEGPQHSGRSQGLASGRGALAGVRVLDFSWALVGSITTKLLADNGADVVKVESATRPCLSRIDVQVAASKRGNFDDKPWFIHMNTSKRSLRINMKRPEAREIIDPLIDWADVIVENFSPGTMRSLGLDYETVSKRRPDIVMVSGSVFGQTGPLAKEWGVDGTGAALSGRLALTGWPDRTPVTPSSVPYGDVILPPVMAAAAAAALVNRARTGRGCHIDASMYEACVQQMAPAILAAQTGAEPQRIGNGDPTAVFQAVIPAGGGRAMAIRVGDAAAWTRLGALLGGGWGDASDASTEARIGDWLAARDPWGAMAELQAAGIAAGVVQTAADIVDRDSNLRERDFLVALDNPALGVFEHQGSPLHLSRTPAHIRTAPALGQHTDDICRDIAGLAQARIDDLRASGLFE